LIRSVGGNCSKDGGWRLNGLATFPLRGTQRDDLLPGLRVTGFERRVTIALVVTAEALLIEGIFYGGRDFEALLRDEE
jgi:toxin ParE1/3/4